MLHRLTFVERDKVLADSGTTTIDLNVRDPITALWVRFYATNGGTSNKANNMIDALSKLEVIDGSRILYSAVGEEAAALAAYQLGYMPYAAVDAVASDPQSVNLPIQFGRFFGDPQYAFDPSKFINPQLRFTWNLAHVRAVGATGFLTGTGRLSVCAEVLEGGTPPVGYLQSKEVYSFTSAASGVTYVDLPIDYAYRALLVMGHLHGSYDFSVINAVKLNCDTGKFIAFDMTMMEILEQWSLHHAPFAYKHNFWCVNGDTLYTLLRYDEVVAGGPAGGGDHTFQYANVGMGEGAADLRTAGSAESGLHQIQTVVTGWHPWGCSFLPLGDPANPVDWFPAQNFKSVRLELTNGAASGECGVLVQQAVGY
jgi:hypothetical protein